MRKLVLQIIKIVDDPLHKNRWLVSLRIREGKKSWVRAVSVLKTTRPISLEEFKESLTLEMIEKQEKPESALKYLKQAMRNEKSIDLEIK